MAKLRSLPARQQLALCSGGFLLIQCRAGLIYDSLERSGIVHGKIGQDPAIDFDLSSGQAFNKPAIRRSKLPASSVDSQDPQIAEIPFARLAIPIRP
jgi:hypothetical protein